MSTSKTTIYGLIVTPSNFAQNPISDKKCAVIKIVGIFKDNRAFVTYLIYNEVKFDGINPIISHFVL